MVALNSQGNLGTGAPPRRLRGNESWSSLDHCPENESELLRLTNYSHHSILSKTLVTFSELKQPPENQIQTDGHFAQNNLFSLSCAVGFPYIVVNMAAIWKFWGSSEPILTSAIVDCGSYNYISIYIWGRWAVVKLSCSVNTASSSNNSQGFPNNGNVKEKVICFKQIWTFNRNNFCNLTYLLSWNSNMYCFPLN